MTRLVSEFPNRIREIENCWIPMPDGVRLAARIWLPEDAESSPVPAILEFIPYRKRDGMARRDEMMHPYFAGHGYAAVRVDLRGSGDSEGVLDDEYAPQEQDDGIAVIEWLARQPWCSGSVGMIGISWGGFNGLQIAARRPAPLKAIVTVGSTDDRYADDVHYMGGAQLSSNFTWAQTFFSDLARPPDPLIVGDAWRQIWLERLKRQTFFIDRWMAHPDRDAYWRHGSVCENYSAIECAVFAVGGWADSYTNAVGRLLNGLTSPRLGLIGPWGHDYPHTAVPGPQIGFLQECLRWWDFWLKGIETGIMDEPLLRLFMQDGMSSDPSHMTRDGRWIGVEAWPPKGAPSVDLFLGEEGLSKEPAQPFDVVCGTPETLGAAAGEWCAYGQGADMPADQSDEDRLSVCFDTPVLDQPLPLCGAVELRLVVVPQGASGQTVVRLNDVDPAGRSARVTYGVLDLGYRDGFAAKHPLKPGIPVEIAIRLCDTACTIPAGHRMRIAISSSYWPTVWPLVGAAPVRLLSGKVTVPLLANEHGTRPMFAPAEASMPAKRTVISKGQLSRTAEHDFIGQSDSIRVVVDDGVQKIDAHGLEVGRRCEERYSMIRGNAETARIEADWGLTLKRGDWQVRIETAAVARFENGVLRASATVKAFDGGELIFEGCHETS